MAALNQPADVKLVGPGVRTMTLFIAGLAIVVGPLLLLLPERTERLFAWTIQPPLTAAFLGGGYFTALVIELMAASQRVWDRARVVYPAVLLFTTLTLIATLLHLDRFHFGSPLLAARATAWAWFAVYVVAPPVMLVLLVYQIRLPGGRAAAGPPLGRPFRLLLGLEGLLMMAVGIALFVAPAAASPLWPWKLTPLTSQTVGSWLVGLGTAAAQAAWENDWDRAIPLLIGNIVFALLQLIALVRFASSITWSSSSAMLYLILLIAILAIGLYGWFQTRRLHRTWRVLDDPPPRALRDVGPIS